MTMPKADLDELRQILGLKEVTHEFIDLQYDPADPDELRIPHDDPRIGFDWRTKAR